MSLSTIVTGNEEQQRLQEDDLQLEDITQVFRSRLATTHIADAVETESSNETLDNPEYLLDDDMKTPKRTLELPEGIRNKRGLRRSNLRSYAAPMNIGHFIVGLNPDTRKRVVYFMTHDFDAVAVPQPFIFSGSRKARYANFSMIEKGLAYSLGRDFQNVGAGIFTLSNETPEFRLYNDSKDQPTPNEEKTPEYHFHGRVDPGEASLAQLAGSLRRFGYETDVISDQWVAVVGDFDGKKRTGYFTEHFTSHGGVLKPYDDPMSAETSRANAASFIAEALEYGKADMDNSKGYRMPLLANAAAEQGDVPFRILFSKTIPVGNNPAYEETGEYAVALGVEFDSPVQLSTIDYKIRAEIERMS